MNIFSAQQLVTGRVFQAWAMLRLPTVQLCKSYDSGESGEISENSKSSCQHPYVYLFICWVGQCDGRYSGKTSGCRNNGLGSCSCINTLHTHLNKTTILGWIFTRSHGFSFLKISAPPTGPTSTTRCTTARSFLSRFLFSSPPTSGYTHSSTGGNTYLLLKYFLEFYRHWFFSKMNKIIFRRSRHIQTAPTSDNFLSERKNSKVPMGPPKRSVLKALKMSVLHVAFFILSWTPYTVMSTWWGSFFRREILIITLGTPLTAHLVTVTPERYKMIFNISNWVQQLEYNLILLLT